MISFVSSKAACKAGGLAAQGRCSLLPLETHLKTHKDARERKKERKKQNRLERLGGKLSAAINPSRPKIQIKIKIRDRTASDPDNLAQSC
jgi:hypothetical protein